MESWRRECGQKRVEEKLLIKALANNKKQNKDRKLSEEAKKRGKVQR